METKNKTFLPSYHTESIWRALPPYNTSISEYQPYFQGIDEKIWHLMLMELTRNYTYGSAINSFVWGTCCDHIPDEFEPRLQEIVDAYNKLPDKRDDDATGYFAFQYCGDQWTAYYTPPFEDAIVPKNNKAIDPFHTQHIDPVEMIINTCNPTSGESVIIDGVSEDDAMKLAKHFANVGFMDINHLL